MLKNKGIGDALLLSAFVVLITLQPYYLYGKINIFENGLYLPGIQAVFDGKIPYRDFFHLRGPLEIYIPAFFMTIFGENMSVLSTYFYIGTVLTLIICIFLAREILQSRLFLFLCIPVLVARTFPRVAFTYWGGIRFGFGLLSMYFAARFFKTQKAIYMLFAGLSGALGFLTSVEIGVCVVGAVVVSLLFSALLKVMDHKILLKSFGLFCLGFLLVVGPFAGYLHFNGAFYAFIESFLSVTQNMAHVFPQIGPVPENLFEAIGIMFSPGHKNFRHMTPAFCYIIISIFILKKIRQRNVTPMDCVLICLATYGFIFYVGAFRNIWAYQFEMALQPEKILLFFLAEQFYFQMKGKYTFAKDFFKAAIVHIIIWGIIFSSAGYSIQRFNNRFFVFKFARNAILGKEVESLKPLPINDRTAMEIDRMKGMVLPKNQAKDINMLVRLFDKETQINEPILMYPRMGVLNFIVNRPFVGRFPMATLSWFNNTWHEEFMDDLHKTRPQFIVVYKEIPKDFIKTNFLNPDNKGKYESAVQFIEMQYEPYAHTPSFIIHKRKR